MEALRAVASAVTMATPAAIWAQFEAGNPLTVLLSSVLKAGGDVLSGGSSPAFSPLWSERNILGVIW